MTNDMIEAVALAEGFCNAVAKGEYKSYIKESKLASDAMEIRDTLREAFRCGECGEFTVCTENIAQSLTALGDEDYNMNWVNVPHVDGGGRTEEVQCDKCYKKI